MVNHLKSGYHECLEQLTNLSRDEIDKGTVLDIWQYRKKDELIAAGVCKLADAADFIDVKPSDKGLSHTERQMLQVAGIPPDKDKGGFFSTLSTLKFTEKVTYPLHFIDFENDARLRYPFSKECVLMSRLRSNFLTT